MTEKDINKIREIFHTEPIQTTGIGNGIIVKFPGHYFKIYDGLDPSSYSVQTWLYGKQSPAVVKNVRSESLINYMRGI